MLAKIDCAKVNIYGKVKRISNPSRDLVEFSKQIQESFVNELKDLTFFSDWDNTYTKLIKDDTQFGLQWEISSMDITKSQCHEDDLRASLHGIPLSSSHQLAEIFLMHSISQKSAIPRFSIMLSEKNQKRVLEESVSYSCLNVSVYEKGEDNSEIIEESFQQPKEIVSEQIHVQSDEHFSYKEELIEEPKEKLVESIEESKSEIIGEQSLNQEQNNSTQIKKIDMNDQLVISQEAHDLDLDQDKSDSSSSSSSSDDSDEESRQEAFIIKQIKQKLMEQVVLPKLQQFRDQIPQMIEDQISKHNSTKLIQEVPKLEEEEEHKVIIQNDLQQVKEPQEKLVIVQEDKIDEEVKDYLSDNDQEFEVIARKGIADKVEIQAYFMLVGEQEAVRKISMDSNDSNLSSSSQGSAQVQDQESSEQRKAQKKAKRQNKNVFQSFVNQILRQSTQQMEPFANKIKNQFDSSNPFNSNVNVQVSLNSMDQLSLLSPKESLQIICLSPSYEPQSEKYKYTSLSNWITFEWKFQNSSDLTLCQKLSLQPIFTSHQDSLTDEFQKNCFNEIYFEPGQEKVLTLSLKLTETYASKGKDSPKYFIQMFKFKNGKGEIIQGSKTLIAMIKIENPDLDFDSENGVQQYSETQLLNMASLVVDEGYGEFERCYNVLRCVSGDIEKAREILSQLMICEVQDDRE